jgi:hypothetical protein
MKHRMGRINMKDGWRIIKETDAFDVRYILQKKLLGFLWWYNPDNQDAVITGVYGNLKQAKDAYKQKITKTKIEIIEMNRTIDVNLRLTAEELAQEFCNMNSVEQAEFFNHIDAISSTWAAPFCFQLQAITDEECLTSEGRFIMEQIGNYSEKRLDISC